MEEVKNMEQEKLGWYEEFVTRLQNIGVTSANPIILKIKEIDSEVESFQQGELENSDIESDVEKIEDMIENLELSLDEKIAVLEEFRGDSKLLESTEASLKFVQKKFQRKVRLLKNRLHRSVSEDFSSYIRHLREQLGLSLKDVERETGISRSYINRMERGQRKAPSYPIIEKLSQVYKVEVPELLKVAGMSSTPVQSLAKLLYSNNFTINGEVANTKQKDILVELILKLDEVLWNDTTKHLDTIELINIIDKYKKLK